MPDTVEPFPVAKGTRVVTMLPAMANRHGLIAGATGTGKTTTLRVLAENFSAIGVPVFLADIKGDLSGMAKAGGDNPKVVERAQQLGISGILPAGYPVTFWDAYGQSGHPVRTTISEMARSFSPGSWISMISRPMC
jgi:DNA helicase HerA-like ATPase